MSKKAKAADAAGCESPPTESGGDSQSPKKEIEHPFLKYLPDMNPADFPAVHPHADIFPMVSLEEMRVGAESVKKDGLQHPILIVHIVDKFGNDVVHILDGRNRWVWCKLAGVEPTYLDITPFGQALNTFSSLEVVIRENLTRRQLSNVERDLIAEKLATAKRGGKQNGELTVEGAAKLMKRSASNLHKVRKLKEVAPQIYARLQRAEFKNIDAAYKEAQTNPEKAFFVEENRYGGYEGVRIKHELKTPQNANHPHVFQTRKEANAFAKQWRAEKEEAAERQAEAERQKAEAEAQAEQQQSEQSQPEAAQPESNNQTDADQPEQAQPEPTAAPAEEEPMVDLTLLPQQQLVELACRVVYPEGAPEPNAGSMEILLKSLRDSDATYSDEGYAWFNQYGERFKEIEALLQYAAGAKKKPLMDDRIVYWVKLMSVKFTFRLLNNRQAWLKSMLNLNYAVK